ncbi:GNAT family N-acetyltransferase [Homoserinibacter sp. GY 40078]|uniref:GNAT family N-acetyltransferase n=1 Tax=Homoserinibacter sp. GY 40078 TaxID=2603275 RepID=UPI0011C9F2C4|nr:GNAT family protein [Homoserinibacter sp. GY 40078]TXK18781.1 GNAT family N-acetyltransferase [Homoserinibacter sp. GY 40078]
MDATQPEREPLVGRFVRLDPFSYDDLPGLWAALGHPEVFAGGYGGGPAGLPADEAAFAEWAPGYFPHERGNTYVVRLISGPHAGEIVGASSLADFDLANQTAHIGWTAYSPRVWGTQVNVEAKLLMLGLAFEHGFGRVKLQADSVNSRSRAAIEKLGARFEGVHRRDQRRPDGTWRDTAVFSVLAEEWPEVRAGLERRLEDWGERPVLYRSMPSA